MGTFGVGTKVEKLKLSYMCTHTLYHINTILCRCIDICIHLGGIGKILRAFAILF